MERKIRLNSISRYHNDAISIQWPKQTETLPTREPPVPGQRIHRIGDLDQSPAIVSISDVHGYYKSLRSALTAVGEVREPVVTEDASGTLHWAESNYMLIFNGDLVDRGEASDKVLELVFRLKEEAPPGRVRLHLGNHEMAIMLPKVLRWPRTYSGRLTHQSRVKFIEQVQRGIWNVAFDGYRYTYSHAGRAEPFDTQTVNERLRACANDLHSAIADDQYSIVQQGAPVKYDTVFGLDGDGRGPDAGLLWMDFAHMPPDAPPQIVGHTRQTTVVQKGTVICQNTIRSNLQSPGGEAVVVETPDTVTAISRSGTGSVKTYTPNSLS